MIVKKLRSVVKNRLNGFRIWLRVKTTSKEIKNLGFPHFSFSKIKKIDKYYDDIRNYNQSNNFDDLLFYKSLKLSQKHKPGSIKKVFLSELIFKNVNLVNQMSLFSIDNVQNYFKEGDVVIVNNNDVFQTDDGLNKYLAIYSSSPDAIFIIWDFDNHHNIKDASLLSLLCDFYIPAHIINSELLVRFNPNFVGHVMPCVIQWSRAFLVENSSKIIDSVRSNDPLGMHIKYDKFPVRNRNVQRLNNFYNSISFVDFSYHALSSLARLEEWSTYKLHWVIPTYNDVPSRIFDALITGGIPLVPDYLKYQLVDNELINFVLFYKWEDLKDPRKIIDLALTQFDELGREGCIQRYEYALNNCHVDQRIELILQRVSDFFNHNEKNLI